MYLKRWLCLLVLMLPLSVMAQVYTKPPAPITVSGGTVPVPNLYGGMNASFQETALGSPASVSITVQGCIGTVCDSAADTNTSIPAIRFIAFNKVYTYFKIIATFTGGTNVNILISPAITTAVNGSGGGGGGGGMADPGANSIVYRSQLNVTRPAVFGDIFSLFTGCSGTQYPGFDGTCHSPFVLGTAGQVSVMNASATAYAPVTISGDSTLTAAGVMANVKINGGTVPATAAILGSNSSSQLIASTLANGKIWIGSVSSLPTQQTVSGDSSLGNTGVMLNTGLNGVSLASLATGILKNTTGTGVPSIAAAADVAGLFTGCSGIQYLGFDGNCHSGGTGTVNSGTAGFPAVYPSSSATVSASKLWYDGSLATGATFCDKLDAALSTFYYVDMRNATAANGFTMTCAAGINPLRNCGGNSVSHVLLPNDTIFVDVTVRQPKACIVEGAGRGLITTIIKPAAALHTIAETNTKFPLALGKLTWATGSPGTVTATFPPSTTFLFNANASTATTTVSGLGAATKSLVKTVTDGNSATDCTVGTGATSVLCVGTGIAWTFAPNVPDGMPMQVGCATATVGGRAPDAAFNGIWRAYSATGSGTATPTVTYRAGNAAATLPASSTGVCTVIFLATPLWLQGDYFQANNYQGIRLEHLNLDADSTCASLSGGICTGASHYGITPLVGINPQERSPVNDLSIINWNGIGIAGYGNDQNWGPLQNIESYMINSNANGNCNPTGANLDGNNGSGASSTVVRAGILPSEHVYLVDNAPKGILFMTGTNGQSFSGANGANCQGSVGGGATVPTALVAGFDISVPAATLLLGDHTELSDIGVELGKQYSGSANASFTTTITDFTGSPAADSDTTAIDISPLWALNSDFSFTTIRRNQGMTNTINNGITGHAFTDANIATYSYDKNGSLVYECGSYTQFPCRVDGGLQAPTLLTEVANAAGGTTLSSLAKITSTGALKILVTDTQSPVWIVAGGAGTTGNAQFVMDGVSSCTMDATNGAGVEGQPVFASTLTAGDCTTSASVPIGSFILGRMISNTTTSGSTSNVLVSAPHRALSDPFTVANASSTGTTLNALAKLTGAPSTLVKAATTDTLGIVGVVTNGAGTSGNATVQTIGLAKCVFDGATTADDYVQISSTVAGDCHDTGSTTRPTSGQIVGFVLSTNGSGGTYSMIMTGPDDSASVTQAHWTETAITNASSPYTVAAADSVITCDATAGAVVINLPAATGGGRQLTFKKIDSSANACTPTRAGADLIDGVTTISITSQYAAASVVDTLSAVWSRTHINQLSGDVIGTSANNQYAPIAADSVTMNATGGTASPSAVTFPACAVLGNASEYDPSTHTWNCNPIANPSLSNLSAVAVNASLSPGVDNLLSLTDLSHRYVNFWASGVYGWTNGSGTADTGLSRDAAGVIDAGNGTAGNTNATLQAAIFNAVSDGVHSGLFYLIGNTTPRSSLPSNTFGFMGPNSASFASYFLRPSSTAPSGTQVMQCGTPSGSISNCTWTTISSSYALQIAGTALTAGDTVNFNNTTPVAEANAKLIKFQTSNSGSVDSVSAELVGNGSATQALTGTGIYATFVPFVTHEIAVGFSSTTALTGQTSCSVITYTATVTGLNYIVDVSGTSTLDIQIGPASSWTGSASGTSAIGGPYTMTSAFKYLNSSFATACSGSPCVLTATTAAPLAVCAVLTSPSTIHSLNGKLTLTGAN